VPSFGKKIKLFFQAIPEAPASRKFTLKETIEYIGLIQRKFYENWITFCTDHHNIELLLVLYHWL